MALELGAQHNLGAYYSGYPHWKLPRSNEIPVRSNSWRTNIVYGLLKLFPGWARGHSRSLFLWQDAGFDRWVGAKLEPCDFLHGMPGQCLQSFRKARAVGVRTVLNHATGPVREWVRVMEPEYRRVGLKLTDLCPYDADYFRREEEEYRLADFHCVASRIVREQLESLGVAPEKIWQVPYGADTAIFHPATLPPSSKFRIVFAGQVGLRKGLLTLLQALRLSGRRDWRVDFYGALLAEAKFDLESCKVDCVLNFHESVSQTVLAEAFQSASVLVLPSLEEGFGLVVPQALNCGTPCIVSDRVGASDLIKHRVNGSIFATANAESLLRELNWWEANASRCEGKYLWSDSAARLAACSESVR